MSNISVIIPFFNRISKTLEAIKSVINQSYDNFEIILIDDGSTKKYDNNFEKMDFRINFFKIKHSGRSAARNFGISKSTGNYITFLDSDDLYIPTKLEKQLKVLEDNRNFGMVYSNYQVIQENGNLSKNLNIPNIKLSGYIYPELLFIKGACITTPSVMVRRTLLDRVDWFDEKMSICEDLDFWRRIARISNVYQIEEPDVLIRYRKTQNNYWKFTKGRISYINRAFLDDPSLSPKLRNDLYIDMYSNYCKWSLKQLDILYAINAYLRLFSLDKRKAIQLISEICSKTWKVINSK